MATSSSAKEKTGEGVLTSDIQAEIAQLTKDVAGLAQSISALGKARISDLQDTASAIPDDIHAASRQALKDLRRELNGLEAKIGTQVKEHPLQSLLLAAGFGALLSLLLRR